MTLRMAIIDSNTMIKVFGAIQSNFRLVSMLCINLKKLNERKFVLSKVFCELSEGETFYELGE